MHQAAALLTYLPGMKFFHQGQIEDTLKNTCPPRKGPHEVENPEIKQMYMRLLALLKDPAFRAGRAKPRQPRMLAEDDTFRNFLAFWCRDRQIKHLITVNYSPAFKMLRALPFPELGGMMWKMTDRLSEVTYERNGNELIAEGIYLDVPAWTVHVFRLQEA